MKVRIYQPGDTRESAEVVSCKDVRTVEGGVLVVIQPSSVPPDVFYGPAGWTKVEVVER